MEIILSVINTLLLAVLFFYQRNRNKVLAEHLIEQRKLLGETKSVVTQQATALEGQGKVVETALKYSEAFNPKKLEGVIRREIEVEHKTQLHQLQKEFSDREAENKNETEANARNLVAQVVPVAAQAAVESLIQILKPLIPHVLSSLVTRRHISVRQQSLPCQNLCASHWLKASKKLKRGSMQLKATSPNQRLQDDRSKALLFRGA